MKILSNIFIFVGISIMNIFFSCQNEPIDPILIGSPQNQQADPACKTPIDLTASNFVGSSINLSWSQAAQETTWQIEYGELGFNQGSGTKRIATINSISVPNLNPLLKYSFYIRSVCGNQSFGEWKGPITVNPN